MNRLLTHTVMNFLLKVFGKNNQTQGLKCTSEYAFKHRSNYSKIRKTQITNAILDVKNNGVKWHALKVNKELF